MWLVAETRIIIVMSLLLCEYVCVCYVENPGQYKNIGNKMMIRDKKKHYEN